MAYQICYVIAAVAAFGSGARAAGIATVTEVVNDGFRTPPGREELIAKRADELVQDEALRTDDESSIQVQFVDGSQLSVEADSELVLSDYVFDGSAANGLINLNDGLFHFKSSGKDDQGVKLRTPVATIGIRGTEFLVHVDGDDVTIVDILSGGVSATPHGSGKEITCYEGQSILIAGADEDAQCGDIGSFSTAAGPAGGNEGPDGGTRGGNGDKDKKDKEKTEVAERPDPVSEPVDPCKDDDYSNNWENDCPCVHGDWYDYSTNFRATAKAAAKGKEAAQSRSRERPQLNTNR